MKKLGLFLLILFVAGGAIAYTTGYAGRAVGYARTQALPKDHTLLKFFDAKTAGVGIVQLPLAKAPKYEGVKNRLEGIRHDLEEVSGIRVLLDVDTIAIGSDLIAARGRFSWGRLSAHLKDHGYTITNEQNRPIAVRSDTGEALTLIKSYLLHGKTPKVIEALDRFENESGLNDESALVEYVDSAGWRHALLGAVKLSDAPLSFSEALTGKTNMRAAMVAVDFRGEDYPLSFYLVPGSAAQSAEVVEMMKKGRDDMVNGLKSDTTPEGIALRGALERANIVTEENTRVRLSLVLPGIVVDKAVGETKNFANSLQGPMRALSGPLLGKAFQQLIFQK
jgi:hypothetical protein